MNLIIYAHPDTDGHNPLILQEVKNELDAQRQKFEVLDLYKMKYDPILHDDEYYVKGNNKISRQNKDIQKKIKKAKRLIVIFPVWWNGGPAILKGFFDRVLTPGFAYKFVNKMPKGLLKGKSAIAFYTTGAPALFYKLMERDGAGKWIKKDIMKFCGVKCKKYLIGSASKLTEKQKDKIKKTVKKAFQH